MTDDARGEHILFAIADAIGPNQVSANMDDEIVFLSFDEVRRLLARMSSAPLNVLRDACHGNAKAKGFHDPEVRPSVGESIALMHSELSEALKDHRKGKAPAQVWYERHGTNVLDFCCSYDPSIHGKPCGVPSEMADAIIRVLDFCGLHDIDIDRAVREKMAYNETRPFRHGGKKL